MSYAADGPLPGYQDAELCALGTMLKQPATIAEAKAIIGSEDFFLGDHRNLVAAIFKTHEEGNVPDLMLLGRLDPKYPPILLDAFNRGSDTNAIPHYRAVRDQADMRLLLEGSHRLIEHAKSPGMKATEAAAILAPALARIHAAEESAWPMPGKLPGLPAVEPFNLEMLPGAFQGFVADIAERMQCPPDFLAVGVMIGCAAVLGNRIGVRPKRHDNWQLAPNLWGYVVARPGQCKSPALSEALKPLRRLQVLRDEEAAEESRDYLDKSAEAEVRRKVQQIAVKKAIGAAAKSKDFDAVRRAKEEHDYEEPDEPEARRYVVNDATVPKLGEILNANPLGVLHFRDELIGWLRGMDKPGNEGDRAFYLESWEPSGPYVQDRIARGTIRIENMHLSILGGVQPGKLVSYLGEAMSGGSGDDGLFQRFQLAVYPDPTATWRNVDRWPEAHAKEQAWQSLLHLDGLTALAIGAETDPHRSKDAPFLRFIPAAQNLFDDWHADLQHRIRAGQEHEAFESHLSKFRSLMPKLALLLHLADHGMGPITEEAARKALLWMPYLESHARRIYSIVTDPGAQAAKALGKRIKAGDLGNEFTQRDVKRKHWSGLADAQSIGLAVDLLCEWRWLKEKVEDTGGRPKFSYLVNPHLRKK